MEAVAIVIPINQEDRDLLNVKQSQISLSMMMERLDLNIYSEENYKIISFFLLPGFLKNSL